MVGPRGPEASRFEEEKRCGGARGLDEGRSGFGERGHGNRGQPRKKRKGGERGRTRTTRRAVGVVGGVPGVRPLCLRDLARVLHASPGGRVSGRDAPSSVSNTTGHRKKPSKLRGSFRWFLVGSFPSCTCFSFCCVLFSVCVHVSCFITASSLAIFRRLLDERRIYLSLVRREFFSDTRTLFYVPGPWGVRWTKAAKSPRRTRGAVVQGRRCHRAASRRGPRTRGAPGFSQDDPPHPPPRCRLAPETMRKTVFRLLEGGYLTS